MSKAKPAIILDTPIKRGDQEIKAIDVIKPNAGALRGAAVSDLVRMEVSALITVLPRVTNPPLTAQEVSGLDPADLFKLGAEVASFFLPKDAVEELSAAQTA